MARRNSAKSLDGVKGRKLTLVFGGSSHPKLERIEFKYREGCETIFLDRQAPNKAERFLWTAVPQALALLILDYVARKREKKSVFVFPADAKEQYLAGSIGNDIPKEGTLKKLFIEKTKSGKRFEVTHHLDEIFKPDVVRGSSKPVEIRFNTEFLPQNHIEIQWHDEKLRAGHRDISKLARLIRKSLASPRRKINLKKIDVRNEANESPIETDEFARRIYLPYRTKEVPLLHSQRLAEYLGARHKCTALRLADATFPVTVLWKNKTGEDGKSVVCDPDSILGTLDRTEPKPFESSPILPPKEYAKARERIKSVFVQGPIKWEGWNYRMSRIEHLGEGVKIHGAVGLYYDNVLTQYALEWELKSVLILGEKHAFKRISQRGSLPLREAIELQCESLLDGSGRCTAMTVSTLLVFHHRDGQRCCLLRRRSQQVGLSPGMLHVVPAGMFEAKNLDVNWSIQANMWSELLEEVYDEKEQQTGPPHLEDDVQEKQPIKWILENLSNGVVEFSVTGICCDLLNLRPEICTVLFIKDPRFLAVRGFKLNWEYDDLGIAGRIAVPWENIDEVIRKEVATMSEEQRPGQHRGGIVCSGAACLALGREWVDRRYGSS